MRVVGVNGVEFLPFMNSTKETEAFVAFKEDTAVLKQVKCNCSGFGYLERSSMVWD